MYKLKFEDLPIEVNKILQEVINVKKMLPLCKVQQENENLNLDATIQFLNKNGYPISKSTLYKLTSKSAIPFYRFGNRLIFKVSELKEWCQSKTFLNGDQKQSVIAVSKSARKFLV